MNTPERNKAVLKRYVDAVNAREFDAVARLVTHDYAYHVDEQTRSHEALMAQEKAFCKAHPDAEARTIDMIAEGDQVAIRQVSQGTKADGKPFKIYSNSFHRLEGGKLAESWHGSTRNCLATNGVW
jgi:predicted SnoaL-like aldol condensation-catalyzing enzyme